MHGDIWAITVRDHYVDVQTSLGKASMLLRFADAVAEAEPTLGTQVHRSHWVAWQGVGSVCREGGKVMLHLKNGSQIPVSRNHRDKVDTRFPPHPQIKAAAA
jgi:DNA-binding LytR/AlgR family response regulator